MSKRVRIVSIALTLSLILTIAIGWGKGNALAAETKIVVDQLGREVKIPKEIKRVVTLPVPLASVFYAVDGTGEKIVGMHPSSMSQVKSSILAVMAPELLNASTGFVKTKFEVNIEELLKLKPDVVFQWSWMDKEIEKMEAVGIPVIAISGGGVDARHIEGWLKIIGKVTGKEDRVAELLAYHHKVLGMISYRIYDISEEEKPKAMVVHTPPLQSRSYKWLELTGAINVAKDTPKWICGINMEQALSWNPEIIYLTNFCETQPEDLLENKIEGQDWSQIEAVKKGQVYKIPMGTYRWDPPNQEIPLMLLWLAQKHHPEPFSDYDIKEEIKKFYSRFYHYELSDKEVEMILYSKGTKRWGGWM